MSGVWTQHSYWKRLFGPLWPRLTCHHTGIPSKSGATAPDFNRWRPNGSWLRR